MERAGIFIFALLLLAAGGHQSHADTVIPSERVVNHVQIRAQPSGSADVVGEFHPGDSAELVGDQPRYWGIERPDDGGTGWVSKAWTTVIETPADPQGELEIHFIDVGQGDSTLIICPNGNRILIDVGSVGDSNPDHIREYILTRLGSAGRVHDLVVTHPDRDHYNLVEATLAGVTVDHVMYVGERNRYGQANFDVWLLNQNRTTVLAADDIDQPNAPNGELECGDADIFVISADEASGPAAWRTNTMSIVLMVRFGTFEAILTGDATTATENAIRSRYPSDWLDVDVLKIGHHGSSTTSTNRAWADAISPQLSIASAGFRSQFGHPRQVVVDRLRNHAITVEAHPFSASTGSRPNYDWSDLDAFAEGIYSTASSGNVVVTSDGQGAPRLHAFHHQE